MVDLTIHRVNKINIEKYKLSTQTNVVKITIRQKPLAEKTVITLFSKIEQSIIIEKNK